MELTDYPDFNVKGICDTFFDWETNKHHGILTYRNFAHPSLMTGTKSTVHHTKWLEAKDDSLKCYLADKKEWVNKMSLNLKFII